MADKHDQQQDPSFHWPPTAEELESIQVFDMSGDTQPPERTRASTTALTSARRTPLPAVPPDTAVSAHARSSAWHRFVQDSVVLQAGLVAASLAAIGIAITSMLVPAQPASRAVKTETRAAVVTPARSSSPTASAPTAAAPQPTFRPMVTVDLESPSAPPQAQRQPRLQAERPRALAAASLSRTGEPAPVAARAIGTRSTSTNTRAARHGGAGRDPVSRFAVRTGLSVWKAMRAVGRSFRRDEDGNWPSRSTARSGVARRTAAAVDLEAGNAPSDR